MTFLSGAVASAATLFIGLAITPILLTSLGEERYGAFRAASEWLAHLRLIELGLAGALAPLLAAAIARGDESELRNTLIAGVRAYARVMFAMLATGALIVFAAPWLVPVDPSLEFDLRVACVIGALGALICPMIPFQLLTDAEQEGYWTQLIVFGQAPFVAALAVWLAMRDHGIRGQMLAVVAASFVPPAILTVRALRSRRGLLTGLFHERPLSEVRDRIGRLSRPTFLVQLFGRASFFTDQGIVGIMYGPAAVVPLFVTQRLASLALAQLQGVGTASWAALADLHARGEGARFNERLVELTRLTSILGCAALAPVVALNEAFVGLWIGEHRFGGLAITVVAVLNAQLHAVQSLWGWALSGTGRVRRLVPVWGVAAIVNVTLSIALTAWLGIIGPLLGTLIAFLTCSVWWSVWTLRQEFGVSAGRLIGAVALPTAIGGLQAAAAWTLFQAQGTIGWAVLLGEMAGTGTVVLLVGWLFVLSPAERALWGERVRGKLGRLRGGRDQGPSA